MKYQIKEIKPEFIRIEFDEDKPAMSDFEAAITNEGLLYINNRHFFVPKTKKGNGHKGGLNKFLELTIDDLPILMEVIEHWKEITSDFIGFYPYGISGAGWLGNTYFFPDGSDKSYSKDKIPDELKYENRTFEPSLDDKFSSNGCEFINGLPFNQHYSHGRFDFRLEKYYLSIDDGMIIQKLEYYQPEATLELLNLIKDNPDIPLEELLKIT